MSTTKTAGSLGSARVRDAQIQLDRYLAEQRDHFNSLGKSLERYCERLQTRIARHLTKVGLVADVSGRVKEWDKIVPKLSEGTQLIEVNDLVGLRVITMYEDEVFRVTTELASLFAGEPFQRRWSSASGRKAGYAGVHVQVRLSALGGIKKELSDFTAELQIRTHLQHVWAELSHNEFYKAKYGVPYSVQDRLYRLAASLDVLSDEIVSIREELQTKTAARRKELLDRINNRWQNVVIDEFTLCLFGNERIGEKLLRLRKIAVTAGFRESAWPEPVRVGGETDLFVPFSRLHDLEYVRDFEVLVDESFEYGEQLSEIGARMCRQFGKNHNLFARPLFILAIVLMLRNPTRPCHALSENIVRVVQEVSFVNKQDHKRRLP